MHAYALMNRQSHAARVAPGLMALGLSAALCACDPQASPFFRGVPLLTVNGSVSIAENHTRGSLQPALAFVNYERGEVRIMEVGVQGRFPSDFRIDIFSPPDDESLMTPEGFEGEAQFALGYITAVTADHPESYAFGGATSSAVSATSCSDQECRSTATYCTQDEKRCYKETVVCPSMDSPPEDCKVESEGDRGIKDPTWRSVAGFSQNYAVVYLKRAAPAGSVVAAGFGAPQGLAAGYHLMRTIVATPELEAEREECVARAEAESLAEYNQAHGTNWASSESCSPCFSSDGVPDPSCLTPPASNCPMPQTDEEWAEADAMSEELRIAEREKEIELGCAMGPIEPVANPKAESIAIEIGPDPQPGF